MGVRGEGSGGQGEGSGGKRGREVGVRGEGSGECLPPCPPPHGECMESNPMYCLDHMGVY